MEDQDLPGQNSTISINNEVSRLQAQEQRSHIAIIQMAPPAQPNPKNVSSSNTTAAFGSTSVVKSTGGNGPPRTSENGNRSESQGPTKRHNCSVRGCMYSTPHTKDLSRHMRKHTGEKPYTCDRCRKSFTRYDKLLLHIRIHEGHRPHTCQHCNYAAIDSSSLRKHLRTHSDERPFKCRLCEYSAKDSSQMVVHLRHHTGDCPYTCTFKGCDAAFKTPSDLSRHSRLHTGEKPYKCLYCDYRAAVKCNLNVHIKRHTNPSSKKGNAKNPQVIKVEAKTKTNEGEREDFTLIKYSYQDVSNSVEMEVSNPALLPFQYACKQCDYKGDTIEYFTTHIKDCHPTFKAGTRRLNNPNTSCDGRTFTQNNEYSEPKEFQCNACNASFVSEDSLRCHIRQHGTIPNKPANVDPEVYATPSRIRVVQRREICEPSPVEVTNNDYTLYEMQQVSHSVITENPGHITGAGINFHQHMSINDPNNSQMYLVNHSNNSEESHHHENELMYHVND